MIFWVVILSTGQLVAVMSSSWAVGHLTAFSAGTRVPPFVIGITLVSIGTDLPEIANSLLASITGHGDINIGHSIGSVSQDGLASRIFGPRQRRYRCICWAFEEPEV